MAFWTILETTILAFTQSKDELIKKLSLKIRLFPILSFVSPSIGISYGVLPPTGTKLKRKMVELIGILYKFATRFFNVVILLGKVCWKNIKKDRIA